MAKSLKTLGRIQKFRIDEQRKLLAEKMTEEDNVLSDINNLIAKYQAEKKFAAGNPNIGDFGAYTKRYLKIKQFLEEKLAQIRQEIEKIRDEISDMFKEQKTFEIVERNRKDQERHEFEQKEQKLLDEIGTNAYIKNHDNQE